MKALILAAFAPVMALSAQPAFADNQVYVTVDGCNKCQIAATAISVEDSDEVLERSPLQMFNGTATFYLPEEFSSVAFEIIPKSGAAGWNSTTVVAAQYRGYEVGQKMTVKKARRAQWARPCVAVTQPETWLDVRVVKNKNPKKYKKGDPTWTRYSLLAFASPAVQGIGWMSTYKGRTSAQNTFCGLGEYK